MRVELDSVMVDHTWCCYTGRRISCWDLSCGVAVFQAVISWKLSSHLISI